jgi:hypothetical protein
MLRYKKPDAIKWYIEVYVHWPNGTWYNPALEFGGKDIPPTLRLQQVLAPQGFALHKHADPINVVSHLIMFTFE